MKENWHTKNLFSTENPEDFVPDPSIPSTEFSYKVQIFMISLSEEYEKYNCEKKSKLTTTLGSMSSWEQSLL